MEIDGYRILKTLGRGGMATVYLARQEKLDRLVALKVMAQELSGVSEFGQRFLREARIMAHLSHPHIVTIFEIGESDNLVFIAMEYLEGGDLDDRMKSGIAELEILDIISKVAQALQFANEASYIHRDIKPGNILFSKTGSVKLTDFGIAKSMNSDTMLTREHASVGTPSYMAPEQFEDSQVDIRADLYSLGIVMFQMLSGHKPFNAKSLSAMMYKHNYEEIPKLAKEFAHLQPMIDRLLAKSRDERPDSPQAIVDYVESLRGQAETNKTIYTGEELTPIPGLSLTLNADASASPEAYRGDSSFIFVCYAHEDTTLVYKELDWLSNEGIRIWFDEGIKAGETWRDEIATAIERCSLFVYFVSPASVASIHCQREVHYAADNEKNMLAIHLADSKLSSGMSMLLNNQQAMMRHKLEKGSYQNKLLQVLRSFQPETKVVAGTTGYQAKSHLKSYLAAIVMMVVVVTGLLVLTDLVNTNTKTSDIGDSRISVLRFQDIGTGDESFFADSLSSEVYLLLKEVNGLKIISQITSWDVPAELNSIEIIERVQASFLVRGKVLRNRKSLNLMISLENRYGETVWEREYGVSANDIQSLKYHIANELIGVIGKELSSDLVVLQEPVVRDEKAYKDYLIGKDLLRRSSDPDQLIEAATHLNNAILIDGKFPEAYSALCRTLIALYEDSRSVTYFEKAEKACHRASRLRPNAGTTYLALGDLYQYSGQFELAISEYAKSIELDPIQADAYIGIASSHEGMNNNVLALKEFNKAVTVQPGYWRSLNFRGIHYSRIGSYQRAIEDFTNVTMLDPENANAFNNIGIANFLLGNFKRAIGAWHRSDALDASAGALVNIATAQFYLHQYDEAIRSYEKAIKLTSEDHRLWGNLADAQRINGDTESAETNYRKAVELAKRNLQINDVDIMTSSRLAVYHAALGQQELARSKIGEILAFNSENPYALYDLAIVYTLLNNNESAIFYLEKSVSSGFPKTLIEADPSFQTLYDLPEFNQLILPSQ